MKKAYMYTNVLHVTVWICLVVC